VDDPKGKNREVVYLGGLITQKSKSCPEGGHSGNSAAKKEFGEVYLEGLVTLTVLEKNASSKGKLRGSKIIIEEETGRKDSSRGTKLDPSVN